MRLWSVHPSLLDRRALVACWREGLLAQKVLHGETTGYRNHPQLERFRATEGPAGYVATFLHAIADEADRRGYSFDRTRLRHGRQPVEGTIPLTRGQLDYEFALLTRKVEGRDPDWARTTLDSVDTADVPPHPLFTVVTGEIASWERAKPTDRRGVSAPPEGL